MQQAACARRKTRKNNPRNIAAPKSPPPSTCIFFVLETPYVLSSCYERRRRYIRQGDCATHRAATYLPAGVEGVRAYASRSLLQISAGLQSLATNEDWWWKKYIQVGFVKSNTRLAWSGELLTYSDQLTPWFSGGGSINDGSGGDGWALGGKIGRQSPLHRVHGDCSGPTNSKMKTDGNTNSRRTQTRPQNPLQPGDRDQL